ncbi:hypothetical protein SAPIO_CDS1987 [Scedosporium apiospermum]|uniref:Uncharacterized protein n=1 Tax=Pseudallescheria apiosperma TaxID=563466 RepID=A0A084GE68_PSEDA|nr:uncharacterized protein SAPIO_CDS1987 [Scedosporium apiospermum]KEZ45630.1 hypothetical protein SAPIO_CDS1987 [Scedosporium apiospermum]
MSAADVTRPKACITCAASKRNLGDWAAAATATAPGQDLSFLPSTTLIPDDVINATTLLDPFTESTEHGLQLLGSGQFFVGDTDLWFLQDESWAKQHKRQPKPPRKSTDFEMEVFIGAVREMLRSWVTDGHNGFIHEQLYKKGMCACTQDAFTTLAAYTSCTPAVKGTILQIAEDRCSALVLQGLLDAAEGSECDAQAVRMALGRTQALFTYLFILIFDGSVWARASAERQVPILRTWLVQLLSTTHKYCDECRQSLEGRLPLRRTTTAGIFDDNYYEAATELWKHWILTESVRRSQIVIEAVLNIYMCMVTGLAECTGLISFTARRGLWDAKSAVRWLELSWARTPLLASPVSAELCISQYAAEEIDEFAKAVWACAIGTEKMQCWTDKSNRSKEENQFSLV